MPPRNQPASSRVWDFYLGGKDCSPTDVAFAEQLSRLYAEFHTLVRGACAWHANVVRTCVRNHGIRHVANLGCGYPHLDTTTHVILTQEDPNCATELDPACLTLCVDSDPATLTHFRALRPPKGAIRAIDGDLLDTGRLVETVREHIGPADPVLSILTGVGDLLADEQLDELLGGLRSASEAGSYLAFTHLAPDPALDGAIEHWNASAGAPLHPRTDEFLANLLTRHGYELTRPVESVLSWVDPTGADCPQRGLLAVAV